MGLHGLNHLTALLRGWQGPALLLDLPSSPHCRPQSLVLGPEDLAQACYLRGAAFRAPVAPPAPALSLGPGRLPRPGLWLGLGSATPPCDRFPVQNPPDEVFDRCDRLVQHSPRPHQLCLKVQGPRCDGPELPWGEPGGGDGHRRPKLGRICPKEWRIQLHRHPRALAPPPRPWRPRGRVDLETHLHPAARPRRALLLKDCPQRLDLLRPLLSRSRG